MKIVKLLFVLALTVVLVAAAWYYRPWSDYSPAKLANLEKPEALVYNYRNMIEFIPGKTVPKGDQTSDFTEQLAGLELTYEFNGQQKTLEQFLQESTTTGLLVIKDDVLVHEQYRTGADRESLFTSWSVAKSFVATVIVMAQREGLIDSLDDKAEKYAPQFAGSTFGGTTLRGLLAMSSGVDFDEDYASDEADIRPFFFDSFVLGKNPDELLLPFDRSRDELQDFHYISPNSHVLSAVLRGIYNKPLAEIISEKIWQPLGMEGDAIWLQHKQGAEGKALGYCCLNARLRDYARFGTFYLDAWQNEGLGTELLPAGWAKSLSQPATQAHRPGGDNYSGRGYSWHFWLPEGQPQVFFAAGVYGQFIWVDPLRNMVIARNSSDPEWTPRYRESAAVFKAIAEHYDR